MGNSIEEIAGADMILVIGTNTTETHPVISLRMKKAVRNGAGLVVIDPRKIELTRWANRHMQLKIGTDIPVLNAMAHVIIEEGLYDAAYVRNRTDGSETPKQPRKMYTPAFVESISGCPA